MTANTFELKLNPIDQKFQAQLNGIFRNMALRWNTSGDKCWILDIYDRNNNPLVSGIPLVTGTDLLAQYEYIGIGGHLFCYTDVDIYADPTKTNLGIGSHLVFQPYV